jgi:hypothetical protein
VASHKQIKIEKQKAMSIYHLNLSAISRSTGRTSVAAAAYRSGVELVDPRTGEVHNYTRKGGVLDSEIVMPVGCVWNPTQQELWGAIELHHKRGDAVTAREIDVALPAELDEITRKNLAVGLAKGLANHYGVAVDIALHAPDKKGNGKNWHAHLLFTACAVDTSGNLGKKVALLDPIAAKRAKQPNAAELLRPFWEKLVNTELEMAGKKIRIDHRSLAAQGIDRPATIHLGPAATAMERRGVASELGEKNRTFEDQAWLARNNHWQQTTDGIMTTDEVDLVKVVQERDALLKALAKPTIIKPARSMPTTPPEPQISPNSWQAPSLDERANAAQVRRQQKAEREQRLAAAASVKQAAAAEIAKEKTLLEQFKAMFFKLIGQVIPLQENPIKTALGTVVAGDERWAAMHTGRETQLLDRKVWPVEVGHAYMLTAGPSGSKIEPRPLNRNTASTLEGIYGAKVGAQAREWVERDKALSQTRSLGRGR